jgi:hypothetical protein
VPNYQDQNLPYLPCSTALASFFLKLRLMVLTTEHAKRVEQAGFEQQLSSLSVSVPLDSR